MKQQIIGSLVVIVILAGCQPENSFTREDVQTSVEDLGISVRNGRFYAGFAAANVKDGGSVTLNFSPYTEKELKKKLGELH